MTYSIEHFIKLWKAIQDDSFVNLRNLFRRYLVEKPYDRNVGQRLIFQLKRDASKLASTDLDDFIKELSKDIANSGTDLKKFIRDYVEDPDITKPENHFLEMLENNCRITKKPQLNYQIVSAQLSLSCFTEVNVRESFQNLVFFNNTKVVITQISDTDAEDSYIEEFERKGAEILDLAKEDFGVGEFEAALQKLRIANKCYGNSKSYNAFVCRLGMCRVLINLKKFDEAFLLYKESIPLLDHLSIAEKQLLRNNLDSYLISVKADLANGFDRLAGKYLFEGKNESAEIHFKIALELREDARSYIAFTDKINICKCLINLEKWDEALVLHKEIVKRFSNLTSADIQENDWVQLFNLVKVYCKKVDEKFESLAIQNKPKVSRVTTVFWEKKSADDGINKERIREANRITLAAMQRAEQFNKQFSKS